MTATDFGALTTAQKKVWAGKLWLQFRDDSFWQSNGFIGTNMNTPIHRVDELTGDGVHRPLFRVDEIRAGCVPLGERSGIAGLVRLDEAATAMPDNDDGGASRGQIAPEGHRLGLGQWRLAAAYALK